MNLYGQRRDTQEAMIDLSVLEQNILKHALVDECILKRRADETGNNHLVAYIVPSGPISAPKLAVELESDFPDIPPTIYVPIPSMPLTSEGLIDHELINSIPVVDSETLQEWEKRIQSFPEIDQTVVLSQSQEKRLKPLHLSDILLDWDSSLTNQVGMVSSTIDGRTPTDDSPTNEIPAISEGDPLSIAPDAALTLTETLKRAAQQYPNHGVSYILPDGTEDFQPYPELLREAEQNLTGLRKLELKPEDKVIFQFDNNREFITAFWSCVIGGFVPVPLTIAPTYREANSVVNKLHNAWQMLGQPLILSSEALADEIRQSAGLLNLDNLPVETFNRISSNPPDHDWHDNQPDDLALLMLTSGSTGMPKGVKLNHRNLVHRSTGSVQMNGFSHQDITLNWMPLDHVAGIIYFHLRDVFTGCQQIHGPTEMVLQQPLIWIDWIEKFRVTITFAPNFAFGLVNDCAEEIQKRHWDLSSMKFVLNGGEAIVAKTARRFLELLQPHSLPRSAMHPAWGMSETSSGVTYSSDFSLDTTSDADSFVSVGNPIPSFSMRIVDGEGRIVQERQSGELQVTGSTVTEGYYNAPDLNAEAFTDDGWFKTGDLGYIADGRLTITGREKDIIIINSVNYYSHEIESVIEDLSGIEASYTAACGVRNPGADTDQLIVFFHPTNFEDAFLTDRLKDIRAAVTRKIGINPDYIIPVSTEAIPKTAIGKIQRSQLSKQFQAGEFNETLKQIDILTGNSNTLPDWFFQKVWRRDEITPQNHQTQTGSALIFKDGTGLGEQLHLDLNQRGWSCICVELGDAFECLDTNHYRINPGTPNNYQQLIEALYKNLERIDKIIHLWTYEPYEGELLSLEALEKTQERGVYSLLHLIQALADYQDEDNPLQLLVISNHLHSVCLDDKIAYEKSPLLGLISTVPAEIPWINIRHLDLPVSSDDENASRILQELQNQFREQEVAYRNGVRWVSRIEKFNPNEEEIQELPFKQGGMYLISGGLGGIGVEISKYLLTEYDARLLLIGRTPLLNERSGGSSVDENSTSSQLIDDLDALRGLGGEVIYKAVDVCDLEGLKDTVREATGSWDCKLDGIIHLAGIYHQKQILEESKDDFQAVLRPKLLGAWSLHQLAKEHTLDILIHSSSVISSMGVFSFGAYASANAFLDALALYQREQCALPSYSIAWSLWDEVGMSRGYQMKELTRKRGFQIISASQGINAFKACLQRANPCRLVGLDGSNWHIHKHMVLTDPEIQQFTGYVRTKSDLDPDEYFKDIAIHDRFGSPTTFSWIKMDEFPFTPEGEVDRKALMMLEDGTTHRMLPQNELERTVASIWQEVLHSEEIGVNDNFFDLGGSSLLMTQVNRKLRDTLSIDISITELFRYPTISSLAKHITKQDDKELAPAIIDGQGRGKARSERLLRRRRNLKQDE